MKTKDLIGPALDWSVAESVNMTEAREDFRVAKDDRGRYYDWSPSTRWAQGGPIIELVVTKLEDHGDAWSAEGPDAPEQYGPTPLIAAMRCYVASKLGDTVEVPEALAQ